jgi:Holliday junction resolvasome RuvABC ATP-dependent DNA helicase subunit
MAEMLLGQDKASNDVDLWSTNFKIRKTTSTLLLFEGPPKVGKTFLAKSVAESLERRLIVINGETIDLSDIDTVVSDAKQSVS